MKLVRDPKRTEPGCVELTKPQYLSILDDQPDLEIQDGKDTIELASELNKYLLFYPVSPSKILLKYDRAIKVKEDLKKRRAKEKK